jgi:pyruvate dehydrogenase E1 component alpha subunit
MTDPARYRPRAEEELWRKRDPIPRLERHLLSEEICDQARLDAIQLEVNETVEAAMRFAEASPAPAPEALYEDLYVEDSGA